MSFISSICSARAEKSFMIVMPKMCSSAFSRVRFAALATDDDRGLELEVELLEVARPTRSGPGPMTAWWFVK